MPPSVPPSGARGPATNGRRPAHRRGVVPPATIPCVPADRPARPRYDWKGFFLLCAIYLAVVLLWRTKWVLPLKLLVVLLHELSHGIAAVLTGGAIVQIQVFPDQGGHCVTSGGLPFVVVSAGYLGSLFFGVVLLLTATRTRASPWVAALLGLSLAIVAVVHMPGGSFSQVLTAAWGVVLVLLAAAPPVVAEFVLRVVAVTSCLYAILDIKADALDRDHPASDASRLGKLTDTPPFLWGLAWIVVSVVVTAVAAKWSIVGARERRPAGVSSKRT